MRPFLSEETHLIFHSPLVQRSFFALLSRLFFPSSLTSSFTRRIHFSTLENITPQYCLRATGKLTWQWFFLITPQTYMNNNKASLIKLPSVLRTVDFRANIDFICRPRPLSDNPWIAAGRPQQWRRIGLLLGIVPPLMPRVAI